MLAACPSQRCGQAIRSPGREPDAPAFVPTGSGADVARPTVAIAHDYLTQRGGAERVVLNMLGAFPDAIVYTTLYDPDMTYPEFRDTRIITSGLDRFGPLRRHHHAALPFSRRPPHASASMLTSLGVHRAVAHGFDIRGRRLVYCHNPARWLYQAPEYLGPAGSARGPVVSPCPSGARPFGTGTAGLPLVPTATWRTRRRSAIGSRARTASRPPSCPRRTASILGGAATRARVDAMARLRIQPRRLAIAALQECRQSGRCIRQVSLIGSSSSVTAPRSSVSATGSGRTCDFISGISDAQIRWVYAHAEQFLAPARGLRAHPPRSRRVRTPHACSTRRRLS